MSVKLSACDLALAAKIDEWAKAHRSEFVRDLTELVSIRSVSETPEPGRPFGEGPAKAVDKGVELGEKYGFTVDNDAYYSVSFILRGDASSADGALRRELGIVTHIDVVPEGNGWAHEPFKATEVDGWLVGRGTADNKGPSVLALYALRVLRDLGVKLSHDVRVIWGASEESNSMMDMQHYARTHTPPAFSMVGDSSFPLCYGEKGIMELNLTAELGDPRLLAFYGGIASNSVPDAACAELAADADAVEKALHGKGVTVEKLNSSAGTAQSRDGVVRISAAGVAAHAAFPDGGESAIQKLAAALTDAGLFDGAAARAIRFIAEAFASTDGSGLGIKETDDIGTSTTHVGGYVRFEDGVLCQNVNVRYAIRADRERLVRNIQETAARGGFEAEVERDSPPRYDDPEDPRLKLLIAVSSDLLGYGNAKPYIMGGGTHARVLPNAVPFGPGLPDGYRPSRRRFGSAHSHDEAVDIDHLLSVLKGYVVALIKLDALLAEE